MNSPTTLFAAIAMAGGCTPAANMAHVVIFRRSEEGELLSTQLDLRKAMEDHAAGPANDIWVRDGDVIILPGAPIERFDDFVSRVFRDGDYGVIPLDVSLSRSTHQR